MSADRIRAAAVHEVDKVKERFLHVIGDIDAAMKALSALEEAHPDIAGRVLSFNTSPRVSMSLLPEDLLAIAEDVGGLSRVSFEVLGQFCVGSIRWRGARFQATGEAQLWAVHGVRVETETTVRVSLLT